MERIHMTKPITIHVIYINCSILGMYLFGGKFCKFMDDELGERECTCSEIIAKHPLCECDRKHFNNFLWATVTVFQVSLVKHVPSHLVVSQKKNLPHSLSLSLSLLICLLL